MICANGWIPPLAHILIVCAAIVTMPPGQRPGGMNDVDMTFPKHRTPAMPKDILPRNRVPGTGASRHLRHPPPGHPPARKGKVGRGVGCEGSTYPGSRVVS